LSTNGQRRRAPRHRARALFHPIAVQLLLIALLLLGHPRGAVALAALTIACLLLIRGSVTHDLNTLVDAIVVANTDMVTGLPTRRLVYQYLTDIPATEPITVVFADVDDLKTVNDTYGHQVGDAYLAAVAQRLLTITGDGDTLVRLGGDEFALATHQPSTFITARLIQALSTPVRITGLTWPLRVSIGIHHTTGGDPHHALGCAEAAMYTAKRRRSGVELYDANRDGLMAPPGVRPRLRRRDQPTAAVPARPAVAARPVVAHVRPAAPADDRHL
jgi:diguanylate cyclase (GGDEF)-like protein